MRSNETLATKISIAMAVPVPDFSALDAQIARLRALGALPTSAAGELADELEQELERTVSNGTDSYGELWRVTKRGERPLRGAAKAVHVATVGRKILFRVAGVEALHHLGWSRGGIVRAIIPTGALPESWDARIRAVLKRAFEATS